MLKKNGMMLHFYKVSVGMLEEVRVHSARGLSTMSRTPNTSCFNAKELWQSFHSIVSRISPLIPSQGDI